MDRFNQTYQLFMENLILERHAVPYQTSIDTKGIQSVLTKNAHHPYVIKFIEEVWKAWSSYHLSLKFDYVNRTKQSSQRLISFEYGTKADGFRGIGYPQGSVFMVTRLFPNHREYEKFIRQLR